MKDFFNWLDSEAPEYIQVIAILSGIGISVASLFGLVFLFFHHPRIAIVILTALVVALIMHVACVYRNRNRD